MKVDIFRTEEEIHAHDRAATAHAHDAPTAAAAGIAPFALAEEVDFGGLRCGFRWRNHAAVDVFCGSDWMADAGSRFRMFCQWGGVRLLKESVGLYGHINVMNR